MAVASFLGLGLRPFVALAGRVEDVLLGSRAALLLALLAVLKVVLFAVLFLVEVFQWLVFELELLLLLVHLELEGLVVGLTTGVVVDGLLEFLGDSLELVGNSGGAELNLGLDFLSDTDEGVEFHLVQIGGSTGLSDFDGGFSLDGGLGGVSDLVVDLDASLSLLVAGVGFGDGFTDDVEASGLWHGGGNLVGGGSTGNADESLVQLVVHDELGEVLEGVFGVLAVNLLDGGGLAVNGLDDGLLSGDGDGVNQSTLDVSSDFDRVSLSRV